MMFDFEEIIGGFFILTISISSVHVIQTIKFFSEDEDAALCDAAVARMRRLESEVEAKDIKANIEGTWVSSE